MSVDELILKTARAVIAEMKRQGLTKENKLGSFKRTERILYEFPELLKSENEETQKMCMLINRALERIGNDPYYEIIDLKYFKGWTHERIAEYFDVDVSVISKQKKRLINRLRPIIFSDEFIKELYEL